MNAQYTRHKEKLLLRLMEMETDANGILEIGYGWNGEEDDQLDRVLDDLNREGYFRHYTHYHGKRGWHIRLR